MSMRLVKKTTPESIIDAVADVSGYSPDELRGRARGAALAQWRHVGMHAARERGMTLLAAGDIFNRHFTTAIMAYNKVEDHRNDIEDILKEVHDHIDDSYGSP